LEYSLAIRQTRREAQRKVLFEHAAKLYKVETPDVEPPVPVG
jgi:hypothetical protein